MSTTATIVMMESNWDWPWSSMSALSETATILTTAVIFLFGGFLLSRYHVLRFVYSLRKSWPVKIEIQSSIWEPVYATTAGPDGERVPVESRVTLAIAYSPRKGTTDPLVSPSIVSSRILLKFDDGRVINGEFEFRGLSVGKPYQLEISHGFPVLLSHDHGELRQVRLAVLVEYVPRKDRLCYSNRSEPKRR